MDQFISDNGLKWWSDEEDEAISLNYPKYKHLDSVFDVLTTFLENGSRSPAAVAQRLFHLKVIDRKELIHFFPDSFAMDLDDVVSPSPNKKELKQAIVNVLNERKDNDLQYDGLEWLTTKIKECKDFRSHSPVQDYILFPRTRQDLVIYEDYKSVHVLMLHFGLVRVSKDEVDESQKLENSSWLDKVEQLWMIPESISEKDMKSFVGLMSKLEAKWTRSNEEDQAKRAAEIIKQARAKSKNRVPIWLQEDALKPSSAVAVEYSEESSSWKEPSDVDLLSDSSQQELDQPLPKKLQPTPEQEKPQKTEHGHRQTLETSHVQETTKEIVREPSENLKKRKADLTAHSPQKKLTSYFSVRIADK